MSHEAIKEVKKNKDKSIREIDAEIKTLQDEKSRRSKVIGEKKEADEEAKKILAEKEKKEAAIKKAEEAKKNK